MLKINGRKLSKIKINVSVETNSRAVANMMKEFAITFFTENRSFTQMAFLLGRV